MDYSQITPRQIEAIKLYTQYTRRAQEFEADIERGHKSEAGLSWCLHRRAELAEQFGLTRDVLTAYHRGETRSWMKRKPGQTAVQAALEGLNNAFHRDSRS